ncbi:MAG TPA: amidohydrolase family protein [Xanthobacteraceae bacterium]|jgi:cytosine/adenosine deaminase-related metal-dependent hydrolase
MVSEPELAVVGAMVLTDLDAAPTLADIVVKNGRIAAVTAPAERTDRRDPVVDGRGKLVIPGLINAHYHSHDVLARGMFEDIPLEVWIALAILPPTRRLTAREVRLRTLLGAIDCLRNGITTVQDMLGCGPGSEEHVEAAIKAYDEVGIRCVLGLQVGNRPPIDCLPGIRAHLPESLAPLLSASPATVRDILDFVSAPLAAKASDRLTFAIAPGSPQRCSFELMRGLAELASRCSLPLVTHVNESKLQVFLAQELYADYGGSPLDFLQAAGALNARLCMAHGIWFGDAEIERIAGAGAAVATCPTSNLKLKNGVAPLRKLKQAGVRLAMGADNTSAGDAQNVFEAMKLVCNLNAGKGTAASTLRAHDALAMATLGGADALGLSDRLGKIEVGMCADLTLLDLSDPSYVPLNDAVRQIVYCESGRGVHTVIVDGNVVVDNRKLMTIDYDALLDEVREASEIHARASQAHRAKLETVLPYIAKVVRDQGEKPLAFNRWPSADDELALERVAIRPQTTSRTQP